MTADEVSEQLCPMGFILYGDNDTWYLPSRGKDLAGLVFTKMNGRYGARPLRVTEVTTFDCPIAAAVWLLTEVSNG